MMKFKRAAVGVVAACLAAATMATPAAMAANDNCSSQVCHWFSGSLNEATAYGSYEAHSITYIEGDAYDDTICIGEETGTAGYYIPLGGGGCSASSSGGVAHATFSGCCYRAMVAYGGPAAAKQILSATHYDY